MFHCCNSSCISAFYCAVCSHFFCTLWIYLLCVHSLSIFNFWFLLRDCLRMYACDVCLQRFVRLFSSAPSNEPLKKTGLYDLHIANKGKMVGFAGYWLPVEFPGEGAVLASHFWTRKSASWFDVSHMGQLRYSHTTFQLHNVRWSASFIDFLYGFFILLSFFGKDRIKFFESVSLADVEALKTDTVCLLRLSYLLCGCELSFFMHCCLYRHACHHSPMNKVV